MKSEHPSCAVFALLPCVLKSLTVQRTSAVLLPCFDRLAFGYDSTRTDMLHPKPLASAWVVMLRLPAAIMILYCHSVAHDVW